jgi:hypothetical protein
LSRGIDFGGVKVYRLIEHSRTSKHGVHVCNSWHIKVHWLIKRSCIKHFLHHKCRRRVPVGQGLVEGIQKIFEKAGKVLDVINAPVSHHGAVRLTSCSIYAKIVVFVHGQYKIITIWQKAAAVSWSFCITGVSFRDFAQGGEDGEGEYLEHNGREADRHCD